MTITVWASTNLARSKCTTTFEIDDEDWKDMTDNEREELCQATLQNIFEWGWHEGDE